MNTVGPSQKQPETSTSRRYGAFVRRVMNGFLIESEGQIFVIQGNGTQSDLKDLLKAIEKLFKE